MDIEQVHIGMKLRNPHAGRTGKVTKIEREGGLELVGNGLSWNEHVENVEPVGEFHVGDRVRQIGPSECGFVNNMGDVGTIAEIRPTGRCVCRWDSGGANTMPPTSIERASACESCEMARVITSQCKQIAALQKERDNWKEDADRYCRNADYWREELTKLQKEALSDRKEPVNCAGECRDFESLFEVAKCYKRVEPEELLLSQDAKRVVESLKSFGCPICMIDLIDYLDGIMLGSSVLDGLIEVREAGIVRLDEGKYSLVGD